jgi:uncharacterized phiE125 gp8 family phage protein
MQAFPRRAAQPAVEPLTLAETLVHLRADSDSGANDAYVSSLIKAARQTCEDRIERTLVSTLWRLKLDGFPDAVRLFNPPVIAVQAIRYLDESGVEQSMNLQDVSVDSASEPGWLVPAPNHTWPATQSGAINAVTIEYTAGYGATAESVPAPLKQWMLLAIGSMYNTRNADGERPQIGHDFADALLAPYRIIGF